MSMMEYKGYAGTVKYSEQDHCLYGKIAYIRDLINYEATAVAELEAEFKAAVDNYLTDCKQLGHEPNKPFKGTCNIRTGSELHRAAAFAAQNESLNAFVCQR